MMHECQYDVWGWYTLDSSPCYTDAMHHQPVPRWWCIGASSWQMNMNPLGIMHPLKFSKRYINWVQASKLNYITPTRDFFSIHVQWNKFMCEILQINYNMHSKVYKVHLLINFYGRCSQRLTWTLYIYIYLYVKNRMKLDCISTGQQTDRNLWARRLTSPTFVYGELSCGILIRRPAHWAILCHINRISRLGLM